MKSQEPLQELRIDPVLDPSEMNRLKNRTGTSDVEVHVLDPSERNRLKNGVRDDLRAARVLDLSEMNRLKTGKAAR